RAASDACVRVIDGMTAPTSTRRVRRALPTRGGLGALGPGGRQPTVGERWGMPGWRRMPQRQFGLGAAPIGSCAQAHSFQVAPQVSYVLRQTFLPRYPHIVVDRGG